MFVLNVMHEDTITLQAVLGKAFIQFSPELLVALEWKLQEIYFNDKKVGGPC